MPQNMVATREASRQSPEALRSPRPMELVRIVCTATAPADTSNVYTCQYITSPTIAWGGAGVVATFSGNTVTFTAISTIGSNTVWMWVASAI